MTMHFRSTHKQSVLKAEVILQTNARNAFKAPPVWVHKPAFGNPSPHPPPNPTPSKLVVSVLCPEPGISHGIDLSRDKYLALGIQLWNPQKWPRGQLGDFEKYMSAGSQGFKEKKERLSHLLVYPVDEKLPPTNYSTPPPSLNDHHFGFSGPQKGHWGGDHVHVLKLISVILRSCCLSFKDPQKKICPPSRGVVWVGKWALEPQKRLTKPPNSWKNSSLFIEVLGASTVRISKTTRSRNSDSKKSTECGGQSPFEQLPLPVTFWPNPMIGTSDPSHN